MARTPEQVQEIARGGYVLKDAGGKPDLILIATGSEVEIAVQGGGDAAGQRRKRAGGVAAFHRRFRCSG